MQGAVRGAGGVLCDGDMQEMGEMEGTMVICGTGRACRGAIARGARACLPTRSGFRHDRVSRSGALSLSLSISDIVVVSIS